MVTDYRTIFYYRDLTLCYPTSHRGGCLTRALKSNMVKRFKVAHVDLVGHRIDRHIEQGCANSRDRLFDHGRSRQSINNKNIVVGQIEVDRR